MIALADQRSFYASAECIFRPDLRDKPVAVLSNSDGCVVALNTAAKIAGVKKFIPYFQQRELIRAADVTVFSSNYELYGEVSRRIMETLAAIAPNPSIEVYSIDEAFMDFTGVATDQLKPVAHELRATIWKTQRIPMGVSVAPTRTLAKLGQYATKAIGKLNGVCVLERPDQWEWLAARVPVEEVWGVGRKLKQKLHDQGIFTVAALAAMSRDAALSLQGVTLARTVAELNGIPCIAIEQAPAPRQQIICSRSFGKKLTTLSEVKQAVSAFAERGGYKLRKQQSMAGGLSVFLRTDVDPMPLSRSQTTATLPTPTNDSRLISSAAVKAAELLFKPGYQYKKAGVILHGISPTETSFQRDLFIPNNSKHIKLMETLDKVNARYGRTAVSLARLCGDQPFSMRRNLKSPSYLTRWDSLVTLKIS